MTEEKFEALVRDLEPYAKRQPSQYRLRVGLLAVLGYVYVVGVLAILIALVVGMAAAVIVGHGNFLFIKLLIPLVVAAYVIARSLWVTIPAPTEPEIKREIAPRLFGMIDDLSQTLQAPRLHHVQLTDDLNAGVVQVPKLGMFGWQTNYLMLGLPLMQALSPEQFRAVLAHELGHLSGNHSRFSGWIYRVRHTWMQILTNLHDRGHWGVRLFTGFFHWYAPFFGAYSFVMARADEYVADRCAAEAAGWQAAAEALVSMQVQSQFLQERFWPDIRKQSYTQPDAPTALYGTMFQSMRQGVDAADGERWLDEALAERTDLGDTHPCLTDRLAALGYTGHAGGPLDPPRPPLALPPALAETAAEALLGQTAERHTQVLDKTWRENAGDRWRKSHEEARSARQDLDLLERQARDEPLGADDAWKRVRLIAQFDGDEAALPQLTALVTAYPNHAAGHYTLGKTLLDRGDTAGLASLERAMALEPASIVGASDAAYRYLRQQGRTAEAMRYRNISQQRRKELYLAKEERARLTRKDKFQYHSLPPEEISRLRSQISRYSLVREAYLMRKQVTHLAEQPLYVLGIRMKRSALQLHSPEREERALLRRMTSELSLPGETFVVLLTRDNAWLGKTMRTLRTARIYPA